MEVKRYKCWTCGGTGVKVYKDVTFEVDPMGVMTPCEKHDESYPCESCKGTGIYVKYPYLNNISDYESKEAICISEQTGGKNYLTGWV